MKLGLRSRVLLAFALSFTTLIVVGAGAWARRDATWIIAVAMVLGVMGVIATLREVNAREAASRALTTSTRLLRDAYDEVSDLYEHAPCGYHSIDADGIVVRMNETELRWLGYDRDEVMGRMHITGLVMPGTETDAARQRLQDFSHIDVVHDVHITYRRKDGSPLYGLMSATAVRDAEGRFVMTRSVVTEITQLYRTRQELETLVGELEAAMASIKTLTGLLPMCSMCHNIRDEEGHWERIEAYVAKHSEAQVSHGLCPRCFPKMFPDVELETV